MKETELRKHTDCSLCKEKIGKSGIPGFAIVKIEQYKLNTGALQRQQGLGMMIGGQLAEAMGPNEDLAEKVKSHEITVCFQCMASNPKTIADMVFENDET